MSQATESGVESRRLAIDAMVRIDRGGAYANLLVPSVLEHSELDRRDRGLVTELVYGATRMRRACDWVADRFVLRPPDVLTRAALRLGTYQLLFMRVPAHAAVGATVAAAPKRSRGFVNAILRKVAKAGPPDEWPSDAVRLSYPDWIVDRLVSDLGREDALAALEVMNLPAAVATRADGYIQDPASQEVAAFVGAVAGERIADVCAAPGGKATAMAASGALVAAADLRHSRAKLVLSNAARLGSTSVQVVVADGRSAPFASASFDRVLVDAPCSGFGVLRRRPDARWRIEESGLHRLVTLQHELLGEAVSLVRPGGRLVYSVCTLTDAETVEVDEWLAEAHPELEAVEPPGPPWRALGRGARRLPDERADGMYVLGLRRRD